MSFDPYSLCPCGSGKKLKFCCSDLAGDIEKVHRMIEGDQPHAALKHVEKLLERQPTRVSLLDLHASLLLSLHEFEQAKNTIHALLAAHPESHSAHAHAAILAAASGSAAEAVESLQSALEALQDEMPLRVLEAIGAVGHALLGEGHLVAARAHLLLYTVISPERDNQALELLLRMNLQAGLPLLLRDFQRLKNCPTDVPWRVQFEEAHQLSDMGKWRRAAAEFSKLREQFGDVPEIVYNLAIIRGWLNDTEHFVQGLHKYATLDVPVDQAVEAEALAQLLDSDLEDPTLDTIKLVYTVTDLEALSEKLAIDKRVEDYAIDPDALEEDAPRPRSTHILMDRPVPATGVDIAREEIPHIVALLGLFGKRTDREAQLEVTTDRDDALPETQSLLAEIAGDSLGDLKEEEVVGKKSLSEETVSWRWRLPDDTPAEHRRHLLFQERREAIIERWVEAPLAALEGKSPREAIDDPRLQIRLLASVLILEQGASDLADLEVFRDLRTKLNLPQLQSIDPGDVDVEQLSLVRLPQFELAKATDDQLAKILERTLLTGAHLATYMIAREMVQRPELSEGIDHGYAYRHLIRLEPDQQQAKQWLDQARQWAKQNNQSAAQWALLDLERAIEQGEAVRLQSALNDIRENHINEPGVAESTYRLLYSAGLISPEAGMPSQAPASLAAAEGQDSPASKTSGIWTPDGDHGTQKEKSAIWTP